MIKYSKETMRVSNVHQWLKYHFGKASKCTSKLCTGKSHNFDYALKTGLKHEKKRSNYITLCRSCHFKYDYKGGRFEPQKKMLAESGRKFGKVNGKIMCKFTQNEAKQIRATFKNDKRSISITNKYRSIAEEKGVHWTTICKIVTMRTYLDETQ